MAFPAVVSVDQILEQLLHSDNNLLSARNDSQKSEMESIHIKIRLLQSYLEKIYPVRRSIRDEGKDLESIRKEVKDLESEIRKKVYEAQDLIEAFISQSAFLQPLEENTEKLDQTTMAVTISKLTLVDRALERLSHSNDQLPRDDFPDPKKVKSLRDKIRSWEADYPEVAESESKLSEEARNLFKAFTSRPVFPQTLEEQFDTIVARAKKIADSMKEEPSSADADQGSSSLTSLKPSRASDSSKIVGQEEDLKELKKEVMSEAPHTRVISITGLPGIGKTTLARSLYEDEVVVDRFTIRSWVTVGQEYNPREIFSKLLASIESKKGRQIDGPGSSSDATVEQLALQLRDNLLNSRYLVVVDDVWHTNVWDRIKNYFPGKDYCSRVIVTTRTRIFDDDGGQIKSDFSYRMKKLDDAKSWELLRLKALGGHFCRPELVGIGRSIAKHCGGLPLSITVVGGQLSQEPENIEYWKIVEDDTEAAARLDKDNYIEILSRSYDHLPSRLKGCFLYMGAFPEDSEILVSKLVKLWVAEGFLLQVESPSSSSSSSLSLEYNAEQCLIDLVNRNLVFPIKFGSDGRIKTCGMHDSIRLLAEAKSDDERFFYSIKKFPSQKYLSTREVLDPLKGKQTQRRLSVHKNILMCMEDVYESAKSIKPTRTLLYAGHYHHHPLPSCLTYDWLRVLDALAVHLVEFPDELVDLIHLRYLALTYNGRLPASLSRLKNLLVLIVRRHPNIIITRKSILPMEIWFMKQLRHIILTECDFPDLPPVIIQDFPLLENLQSLSNINAAGCTRDFFKNVPNLLKLGVWIESPAPVNIYLDHIPELEVFKLAVLKPVPGKEIAFQEGFSFPQKLKKLSLSGCGLPWSELATIGEFPCLQVLKLRQFAFRGPEWRPEEGQFPELKLLLIECLDLKTLTVGDFCCGDLKSLIIKNCYELETIDEGELESIGTLEQVELVGCNYAAVRCVENTRDAISGCGEVFTLRFYSPWGEESSPEGT